MVVAQWQAWTDAGTLSKPEAMVAYCDLIMDIEPDYMFKVCNNRACVNLYAALVLYTVCFFFSHKTTTTNTCISCQNANTLPAMHN